MLRPTCGVSSSPCKFYSAKFFLLYLSADRNTRSIKIYLWITLHSTLHSLYKVNASLTDALSFTLSLSLHPSRSFVFVPLFLPFSSLHPAHHHGDDEVDRIKDVDPETGCRFRSNPPSDEDKDYVPTVRRNPTGTAERGEVRDGSRTPSRSSTRARSRLTSPRHSAHWPCMHPHLYF